MIYVMTKQKIEEGMEKFHLIIKEVGPAIDIFDDSAAQDKFEVRRSLRRQSWTIRTIPGKQKVMVLYQPKRFIASIGDSGGSIGRAKRWTKGPQK